MRPSQEKIVTPKLCPKRTFADALRGLGASGLMASAVVFNVALNPDAYAQTQLALEAPIGFFAAEPAFAPIPADIAALKPVDETEVRLLAATAWGEARSEGEHGMRAVAHVMVNRVGARFGDSLESVIRSPRQFSVWNRGDPNRPLVQNPERYATGGDNLTTWRTAQRIAREVLSGQSVDPTNGALFYHTTAIRPWWSRYGEGAHTIGAHIFYADVPDQPNRRGRITRVAQSFAAPAQTAAAQPEGPRAGRVQGVLQHAPPGFSAQLDARLDEVARAQAQARAQGVAD